MAASSSVARCRGRQEIRAALLFTCLLVLVCRTLSGGSGSCPPRIIIAGAPAAGKGTQCAAITANFGCVHLSTGDLLREAVKEGSALGKEAKQFMEGGKLVPDELITSVVLERLQQPDCSQQGWLLDGFPRTKSQADALTAAGFLPDCFVLLDVPEQDLVERVTGRRIDPVTGKIYHLTTCPPPVEVIPRLVQRSDDTAEKIVTRYREFRTHVDDVAEIYKSTLVWVDGRQEMHMVQACLSQAIAESLNRPSL